MNKFIDLLFKDYWSISPNRFNHKCTALKKNPKQVLPYLIEKGAVRIIANNHIEFVKYL